MYFSLLILCNLNVLVCFVLFNRDVIIVHVARLNDVTISVHRNQKLGWGSNSDVLAMLLCLAARSDSLIVRAPVES